MSASEAAAYASRRVFVIAGHGTETPGSFQLSDECEVVVKKNMCEVAFESDFHDAMEGLLSLPEEVARHPTRYRKEIIQRLGSVMVYSRHQPRINGTEGSCINLIYHLMMMHFREDDRGKHVEIYFDMGSGIIDFARWKAARTHIGPSRVVIVRQRLPGKPPTAYHDTAENIQLIGGLYEHSVFPTMDMIETYLGMRWKEEEVELYDMLVDLRMQPFVNVTQQFLCTHFPGVYYHMICRSMAKTVAPQIKEYVAQWQNWKKGEAAVKVKKMAANPLFDKRYFIESLRRRHALHNYYHSHLFQEKQHTTNKANCRNLEARITSMEGLLDAVDQQERTKIQRKIRLLRTIRNEKHADCVRREVQRAAERVEASAAAAQRSRSRSHSKSRSRSRSQSPTRNHNQTRRQSHQTRNQTRNQTRRHANKQNKSKSNKK